MTVFGGKSRLRTIRASILRNFSMLIILISIAFFSAFIIVAYTQSTMVFAKYIRGLMRTLQNDLHNTFDPVNVTTHTLARLMAGKAFDPASPRAFPQNLIPILEDLPQVAAVHSSDGSGNGITLYRKDDGWISVQRRFTEFGIRKERWIWDRQGNRIGETAGNGDIDPFQTAWYQQAAANTPDRILLSPPRHSAFLQKQVLTFSIQFKMVENGSRVLAFDLPVDRIPGMVDVPDQATEGVIFFLSEDEKLIGLSANPQLIEENIKASPGSNRHLTPDPKRRRTVLSGQAVMKPVSETGPPLLLDMLAERNDPGQRSTIGGHGENLIFFRSGNHRYVGTIHPMQVNRENKWLVGFAMRTAEYRHLEPYMTHIYAIPVILCLALIFALLMSKKMSRRYINPLTQLVKQSMRISRMDLTKGPPIHSEILELQQLADSQETMRAALETATTELKISNTKLEEMSRSLSERVEERTAELQKKSEELALLNQTLEEKVKKEVEASSQKDRIMLQSARQAQMGEMISMIAHQWRQPLSSISTVTGNLLVLLELESYDKEQFKELLTSINRHAQYLSKTINDFRNFFRPNRDRQQVMLDVILKQTLNIIGQSLTYNGIRLETEYQFTTALTTYANELTQVFLNIVKNAQDVLMEREIESPVIHIHGREENGWQIVEIRDNAGGIPETVMDKIFEPYFSTKGEKTGTGLGLYMSKLIVEKHCRGELTAANDEEGACFSVRLPV